MKNKLLAEKEPKEGHREKGRDADEGEDSIESGWEEPSEGASEFEE